MDLQLAIKILESECYVNDFADIEKSILINRALDTVIKKANEQFNYEIFMDDVCDFMTERANQKEKENRKGFCDMGILGFVRGIRWSVSVIKSNLNLFKGVK